MSPHPRHQSPSQTVAIWPGEAAFCGSSNEMTIFPGSPFNLWTEQATSRMMYRNLILARKPLDSSTAGGGESGHIQDQSLTWSVLQ